VAEVAERASKFVRELVGDGIVLTDVGVAPGFCDGVEGDWSTLASDVPPVAAGDAGTPPVLALPA
jgi:hypothetical protein